MEQDVQDVCDGFKKLPGRASFHPGIARTLRAKGFLCWLKQRHATDGQEVHTQEQKVQMLFNRIKVTSILPESFRMTLNSLKDKDRADSNLDEYCTTLSTKLFDLKAERDTQTGFGRDRNYREISQVGSKRGGHGRHDNDRRPPRGCG